MEVVSKKITIAAILESRDTQGFLSWLLDRVEMDDSPSSCWTWLLKTDSGRYPTMAVDRGTQRVRPVVMKILRSMDYSDNHAITDTCGNGACVNPDHLVSTLPFTTALVNFMDENNPEGMRDYLFSRAVISQSERWEDSSCWLMESNRKDSYIQVTVKSNGSRRNVLLHRLIAEFFHGADIAGSPVHHKCANRQCTNPDHLQVTTHQDNFAEMLARSFYETRISEAEVIMRELLETLPEGTQRDKVEAFLLAS